MSEEQKQEQAQSEPIMTEFVFMGQRVDNSGKRNYLWARVAEPNNALWFGKPLVTASVGGVYMMWEQRQEDNRTTIFHNKERMPKYIRRFNADEKENELVAIWAAADEAAKQHLNTKALNTKAAKVEPLDDLLERVSRIAQNLNKAERRALMSKLSEACWL